MRHHEDMRLVRVDELPEVSGSLLRKEHLLGEQPGIGGHGSRDKYRISAVQSAISSISNPLFRGDCWCALSDRMLICASFVSSPPWYPLVCPHALAMGVWCFCLT